MHMFSMWPFKAKEQRPCVDTEEDSVTFDLQNTNIDFCLVVFTSSIKKVFYTYMYVNCAVLHFMSFNVFLFVFHPLCLVLCFIL